MCVNSAPFIYFGGLTVKTKKERQNCSKKSGSYFIKKPSRFIPFVTSFRGKNTPVVSHFKIEINLKKLAGCQRNTYRMIQKYQTFKDQGPGTNVKEIFRTTLFI